MIPTILEYLLYPKYSMRTSYGLCCNVLCLRERTPSVFPARRAILKTVLESGGLDTLRSRVIQNLNDVITILHWCDKHDIRAYRLSSDMFPHKSNPRAPDYDLDFADDLLKEIGSLAREKGIRLTFHPGQYNVVGTPNEQHFAQTCIDLSYHAEVLDRMGMGIDSVMVVHGGGLYGDKKETIARWCDQFHRLPESVKARLVLENCEKCFNIEDCLEVSRVINIPVVYDTHHHSCYQKLHPDIKLEDGSHYIERILKTWTRRNIRPKFHVSEQGAGRVGHHSDYIENIPIYLRELSDVDIMIEAKMKERAIFRLRRKYEKPSGFPNPKLVIVKRIM